jgi:hypothetical protein
VPAAPSLSISADEARRAALRAQALLGPEARPKTVGQLVRRLGGVQLDTISVLARSHELVSYSRLGAVGRDAVEAGLWNTSHPARPDTIEYWGHAACVLPIETWPWLAFRRRRFRTNARWQMAAVPEVLDGVRARLAAEGPLTASGLGGAKQGGPWWDWSPVKVAVEVLLDFGEVVCVTRRGWKRVYDLAERALPADLLDDSASDQACFVHLVTESARRLGVATTRDLADYYRLHRDDVAVGLAGSDLIPVTVEGWEVPAWAHPAALEWMGRRGRHRTTLLSPFDSLTWDRSRTERLFGFTHRIEAYTPKPQRVHGYYPMPVLAGGRLVGRVDPGREGRSLVAKQVGILDPGSLPAVAAALLEAAGWVGADSVAVGVVDQPGLRASLVQLVS